MVNAVYEIVYRLYDKAVEGLGLSHKVLCPPSLQVGGNLCHGDFELSYYVKCFPLPRSFNLSSSSF
jgi:hypothetical protein